MLRPLGPELLISAHNLKDPLVAAALLRAPQPSAGTSSCQDRVLPSIASANKSRSSSLLLTPTSSAVRANVTFGNRRDVNLASLWAGGCPHGLKRVHNGSLSRRAKCGRRLTRAGLSQPTLRCGEGKLPRLCCASSMVRDCQSPVRPAPNSLGTAVVSRLQNRFKLRQQEAISTVPLSGGKGSQVPAGYLLQDRIFAFISEQGLAHG